MDVLGVRELRGDLARHVRRAQGGERIGISVGGQPVAALVPLTEVAGTVEGSIAAGAVLPPRRSGWPRPSTPVATWSGIRLDRLLRDLRG